jgi:PDZ domain-containing secreted protein
MRSGSAITTINGNPIRSADDLTEVMHQTKPGQQATVSWVDVDGLHTETMELITAPAV